MLRQRACNHRLTAACRRRAISATQRTRQDPSKLPISKIELAVLPTIYDETPRVTAQLRIA
jgi:hypothetical protein